MPDNAIYPHLRHRVYLLDLGNSESRLEHWTAHHPALVMGLPGIMAYRQNRPIDDASLVCSETWFVDAESERTAFESEHYHGVVAPDERRFVTVPARHTTISDPALPDGVEGVEELAFDGVTMTSGQRRSRLRRPLSERLVRLECRTRTWIAVDTHQTHKEVPDATH